MYTIRDIKQISHNPYGIIINKGIIISISLSLFVQLLWIKYRYYHQYYLFYIFIRY